MKRTITIILLTLLLSACGGGSGLPKTAEDALDGTISNVSRYNNPEYDIISVVEIGDDDNKLWCVLTSAVETTDLRDDNSGFYERVSHFVIRHQDPMWSARPIYDDMGNDISGQSVFEDLGCDNWIVADDD